MIINLQLRNEGKAEKNWFRFRFGVWLVLMLVLSAAKSYGQVDRLLSDRSYYSVANNERNGYVSFQIPIFDDRGDNEWVYMNDGKCEGHLYVTVDGKREEIITYGSESTAKDMPTAVAYMTLNLGSAVFKTTDGNKEHSAGTYNYRFSRQGQYLTYMIFDWHYPPEYEGKVMNFSVGAYIAVNGEGDKNDYRFDGDIGTGGYNARDFSDPTLGTPTLSYTEVGKYQMTYNTTETPVEIWNSIDNKWSNSTNKSGTLYAPIQDSKREYTFKVKYQLNQFYKTNEYSHSVATTIKGFQQAQNFKASAGENGNTSLTWSIFNKELNCETGDNFEIQRAQKADFESSESVGTVDFDPNRTSYSFTDNSGNQNLNGTLYYRIRRTKQAASWGWSISQKAQITKNISHRNVVSATAERHDWSAASQAKISWDLEGKANNKVWSDGAELIVTRTMDYGKGTIKSMDLTASAEDIKNGYMIDNLDALCVKYSYTVRVKPGNTHFKAQEAVTATVAGEPIFPTEMGKVASLTVSKGYFPTYTSLQWTTDEKAIDQFQIMRRSVKEGQGEDDGWDILQTDAGGTQASYVYIDEHGLPGVVYEYQVRALTTCADETSVNRSEIVRGFRSPTGTISGQILFKYGDAMVGAEVLLTSAEPGLTTGQSLQFAGSPSSYMETATAMTVPTDASIQLFVKPAAGNQNVTLLSWGRYRVGIQGGKAAISADGGANWQQTEAALPTDQFTQLTAVFDTDLSLYLYVDGEKVIETTASGHVGGSTEPADVTIGKSFNGYLDEIRLWERALDEGKGDIKNTYNRLLTGNENGLVAYWRLNDPVTDETYDISYTGTNYHKNHAKLTGVKLSTDEHPTDGQLGLRGLTDGAGNYQITGVPYIGSQTSYVVTPSYTGHTFEPVSTTVTIGNQQPVVAGTNFKDASAFTIRGYVFYENSTIPITGVTFSVDGVKVVGGNNSPVTTDAEGKFSFSVPTGTHSVQVEKANHVFKDNGFLLDDNGLNFNYQDESLFTDVRFWDQTKVKLIGRVAGGTVEGNKPLGFSLSKNNLGDDTYLKLTLEGNTSAYLSTEKKDSTMTHYDGKHSNTVSYEQSYIKISPDRLTGEFTAWLYPEKYKVDEISVKGHGDLLSGMGQTLSLTDCFNEQTSEYMDGNEVTHRIIYNADYNYTRRVDPALTYVQLNRAGGKPLDYFGDKAFLMVTQTGDNEEIMLYDEGNKKYLFDHPVFHAATYHFRVSSHEDYYYNNVKEGEEIGVDQVPTQGGILKITNQMGTISQPADVELDDNGSADVEITVNNPDITGVSKGVKSLDFSVGGTTAQQLEAIVLGARVKGNSYVTAGPIRLFNILRDPPGSNSYSYCEKGQVYSYHSSYATGKAQSGSETVNSYFGPSITSGVGVMVTNEAINTVGVKSDHEVSSSDANSETFSITTTSRYQTSDDPLYVGADGDLFLGTTSNIQYGPADDITLMTKEEYQRMIDANQEGVFGEGNDKLQEAGDYVVAKRTALSVGVKHDTFFAYPQIFIKNTLMDNIRAVRNSLFAPYGTTEAQAKAMADVNNAPVYLTHRKADEADYGEDNKINNNANGETVEEGGYASNGDSYTVILPSGSFEGTSDSIYVLNQSIRQWEALLEQNEKEKVLATDLISNYSIHAGALMEYAEEMSHVTEQTHTYNLIAGGGLLGDLGFKGGGVGVVVSIEELGYGTKDEESGSSSEETRSAGFVLADEGDDDFLSVNVYRVKAPGTENEDFNDKWDSDLGSYIKDKQYGSFVFLTQGGATSCPYEGELRTEYYNPGTVINKATSKIENPKISVEKPVISNVPSDQAATFVLNLYNESEIAEGCYFNLSIVDAANQQGAKFSIDGVPLADKRGILVNYGEPLQKTLEIRRGTEYDYEDLAVVISSQCQADPTGFQDIIADTVYISAHFIPSSSDINIKSPTDKWTLNTQSSLDSTSGKYYMPLTIDGFDVNFQGFDHIEIQYKPSSGSDKDWTNICSFYNDSVPYKAATGEKAMIEGATISTRFYGAEDQKYDIRAVTFSKVGNEFVTKSSPIISGVKDTKRPVVFGNIQPADGVLGIEDEIRLTFNEEIAEGYMTDVKNFQVTAVRNGSNGDHSTSLTFDGASSYLATQAERNLTDKDFSVEMWVLPATLGQEMTLFSHGTTTNALELSIGADNSIQVSIGGKVYTSKPQSFKTSDWAHVAMTYKASNRQLSAYFGGTEVITGVQTSDPNTSIGPMLFGRSVKGGDYFAGKMHEARVWNKVVSSNEIMANKLTIYTGQEAGMLAYYPMNDGKGDRVTDKAQGATAWVYGADWSTLAGLSVAFKGDTLMAVNSSKVALTDAQDYTLEFWFKAAPGQKDAALVSNGKGVGDENNTNRNKVFVGFADNKLVFRNNGHEEVLSGKWDDDSWHHFAIAVNRNAGNAQVFLDGALNTFFDAGKLGGFSGTTLYLGARRWTKATQMVDTTDMYLKGQVDELRLWNMALPSTIINKNYNVCPKGTEMGLMMYLPFSKYIRNSANVQEMVFSGEDMVTDSTLVTAGSRLASEEKAPVRAKGPEVSIPFTFVVNKDALVINLMDTPEALEKTAVNFTVKDVSDLNGNLMQSPVTWSAYINRNQLKWSKPSITKEKKLYAPMSFTVDVENQGGTEKNFTIEGLPAWLKADPEYGTIDPLGRQTILFTVDEGTNVGRYDEVVYVKGDNNVSEALPVTLKVFDEQPDWTVDPADFKYNMNIYGKLRVNKLFSTDAEDMIAVFDGGRCVGVANNQYADKNDMWYVFLTVYGNEIRGSESLSFRVWDASTGTVYDAWSDSPITFGSNSVVGTASTPVIFDAEERVVQNINLTEGWNWVSFNVKSDTPDLATILKNTMLAGDEQVKDEAMGSFAAYDQESKTWLGNNIVFDNKHMYLIQSSVAQKLSVSGIAIKEKEDLTIPVANNWNYISYLPMTNLPIGEALSGYNAKEGDIVKSQNAFSMYGVKTGWLGNLTYMEPGKGYMLLNNGESTSLVYPDMMGGSGLRSTGVLTRSGDAMTTGTGYADTRFEANMSVVATVAESLPVYASDKLQAYVGGELRGEALLTEDPYDGRPLYFVSIGGDRNESVSFALERGGEIIAETSPMFDYRVNNVQGSIEQPVILDFVNDLQISVYPNPFERELNFVMNTQPGDKVGIYLYTMAGQMIHRHSETSVNGGYLHYRWECYEDLARTVYMAVVVVNGQKHVYKVKRK